VSPHPGMPQGWRIQYSVCCKCLLCHDFAS
jgi:hypothetical protein